jgi:G:T-mismatch repair DNA endonuclease (very short patch repair protein)
MRSLYATRLEVLKDEGQRQAVVWDCDIVPFRAFTYIANALTTLDET